MSSKIDLKKELKQLYNPSAKEVSVVNVPAMNFLMIDGEGAPSSQQYMQSIEALFTVSYTLKFMIKKAQDIDYTVMPLEGLWWMDNMSEFSTERKDEWIWTSMIMQPEYVKEADVKAAVEQARKKKPLQAMDKMRFESSDLTTGNIDKIAEMFPGVVTEGKVEYLKLLRAFASDPRWRIREGVAMALQIYGESHMDTLIEEMEYWSKGNYYEQRAAAAALCEPKLLDQKEQVARVLQILDGITLSITIDP